MIVTDYPRASLAYLASFFIGPSYLLLPISSFDAIFSLFDPRSPTSSENARNILGRFLSFNGIERGSARRRNEGRVEAIFCIDSR